MDRKVCSKCGIEKEIKEYTFKKSSKDGLNIWCKDCCKEYAKKYIKNNALFVREYKKRWTEKNINSITEKKKKYYKENTEVRDRYLEINKERINEYNKQYRFKNIEKIREYDKEYKKEHRQSLVINEQRRSAKKKQLPSTLTIEQWNYAKEYFDNRCAYCGEEVKLVQEHFVALSKGGEYTINNIIPSCIRCNSSKGTKIFIEWYKKQKYYSQERELKIYEFLNNKTKENDKK